MLTGFCQDDFAKIKPSVQLFIEEQAELAYKQGSMKRLVPLVRFLDSQGCCQAKYYQLLAEASLKTGFVQTAEFALERLVDEEPDRTEFQLGLVDALVKQCKFEQAQQLLAKTPLEKQRTRSSKLEIAAKNHSQLILLISEFISSNRQDDISKEECLSNGQALLDVALQLEDRQTVIKIVLELAQRSELPDDFVLEICWVLNTEESQCFMDQFVLALVRIGDYHALLREYLNWYFQQGIKVPNKKELLKVCQEKSIPADLLATLLAMNDKWLEFPSIIDRAMSVPKRLPVLCKYSVVFWLNKGDTSKVNQLLDEHQKLPEEELRYVASGLELSPEWLPQRLSLLQTAVERFPDSYRLHNDLGDAKLKHGDIPGARQHFFDSWNFSQREYFPSGLNLANSFLLEGGTKQAFDFGKIALALEPEQLAGWQLLSRIMVATRNKVLGYQFLRICISKKTDDLAAWFDYANAAKQLNHLSESRLILSQLLEKNPRWATVYNASSLLEMSCGNVETASEQCLKVLDELEAERDVKRLALSNLLFCGNYHPSVTNSTLKNWFSRINDFLPAPIYQPKVRQLNGDKIRIGYVSSDFKLHPVAFFLEALFKHHDKQKVEVFAYSGVGVEDSVTDLLKEYVDHWAYIARHSDDEVAEMIVRDRIDVLVDLSGHTDGARLGVFARKPCAVQVSWLGFAQTTGMTAMDYFLGDHHLTPSEADSFFSEQPYRLPRASYCYTPRLDWRFATPIVPQKAPDSAVVFGNFGRAIRFNEKLLPIWKQILDRVPNSILKIDNPNFSEDETQEMMYERLEKFGIKRERAWVGYTVNYIRSMLDIDIALDGFPQNSGTTLFEFLWCGVPIVTKRDRPSVGRLGAMVLHGLGRDEWIADTVEQYIDIAVELASDKAKLHGIRQGLRNEFICSELCDGAGFARAVEDAYLAMLEEKSACQ